MQDRTAASSTKNLLRRTAGPYISGHLTEEADEQAYHNLAELGVQGARRALDSASAHHKTSFLPKQPAQQARTKGVNFGPAVGRRGEQLGQARPLAFHVCRDPQMLERKLSSLLY